MKKAFFVFALLCMMLGTAAAYPVVNLNSISRCSTCNGTRFVVCPKCRGTREQACSACNGTGNMPGLPYGGCVIYCRGGKAKCDNCNYVYNSDGTILCRSIDDYYGSGKVTCPSCRGKGTN